MMPTLTGLISYGESMVLKSFDGGTHRTRNFDMLPPHRIRAFAQFFQDEVMEDSLICAAELLRVAQKLAYVRTLVQCPGWSFGADWDNPDPAFQQRRQKVRK